MPRACLKLCTVMLSMLASTTTAAVAEGGLVRIEPRPYYGAVVTVEHGVRVFRPLPTQNLMVINPGGQTPLSLSFNRTVVQGTGNASDGQGDGADYDGGAGSLYGYGGGYGYLGRNRFGRDGYRSKPQLGRMGAGGPIRRPKVH